MLPARTKAPLGGQVPIHQTEVQEGSATDTVNGIQKVYYDLSSKDSNPFPNGLRLGPSVGPSELFNTCLIQSCANEVPCCDQYHPSDICGPNGTEGDHTKCCADTTDLTITLLRLSEVTWITRLLVTSYYYTPERTGDSVL